MNISDNDVLVALWPQHLDGSWAPRAIARAVASLCGGQRADAIYCDREDTEGAAWRWHILALSGTSLIEVLGEGVDLHAQQASRRPEQTEVTLARCVPLASAFRGLHLAGTPNDEGRDEDSRWTTLWRLVLDTGEVLLPRPDEVRSRVQSKEAETFAMAVLERLRTL